MNRNTLKRSVAGLALLGVLAAPVAVPIAVQAQGDMNSGGATAGTTSTQGTTMMGSDMDMGASAGMMQSGEVSGVLLRSYVDVAGNVTAMDIRTATGVRQVRFMPAMMSTDERLANFRMGGPITVTGVSVMGLTSYDPNGPLGSGLLMGSSNMMAGMNNGMAGGTMSGTTGGAMSGTDGTMMMNRLSSSGMVRGTDLSGVNFNSAAQLAMSPFKGIVRLPDGRVTVIREVNGRTVLLSADNHSPTEVTVGAGTGGAGADGAGGNTMRGSRGALKGARVMTINPDGTITDMNADGTAGGTAGGNMSGMAPDGTNMTSSSTMGSTTTTGNTTSTTGGAGAGNNTMR